MDLLLSSLSAKQQAEVLKSSLPNLFSFSGEEESLPGFDESFSQATAAGNQGGSGVSMKNDDLDALLDTPLHDIDHSTLAMPVVKTEPTEGGVDTMMGGVQNDLRDMHIKEGGTQGGQEAGKKAGFQYPSLNLTEFMQDDATNFQFSPTMGLGAGAGLSPSLSTCDSS